MSGWALCAGIALGALALLAALRFPLSLATLALAAAALGAAGYAWQGRPDLPGAPVAGGASPAAPDDDRIAMRSALFGRYGTDAGWFIPADAMMRLGAADAAARFVESGINQNRRSAGLWSELGTIIAAHDQAVSPAALLAFRQAIAIDARDPAPWYFLGQAQVRGGDFDAAAISWTRALALSPANAGYRATIALRAGLLDRYLEVAHDQSAR